MNEWMRHKESERRFLALAHKSNHKVDKVRVWLRGEVRAFVTRNFIGEESRWHLSVSCAGRYPTWDEIADARYDLLPAGIDMAMILPPLRDYVNDHPFVLQLHEITNLDPWIDREVGQARTHEDGSWPDVAAAARAAQVRKATTR